MTELKITLKRSDVVKMLIDGWTTSELKAVAFKLGISGEVPELRAQVKFALMTPVIKWSNTDE
jgi:hypothetical protein|tara:strand:+ start:50 stop:238 length:189 start_codon:yes stop_codon:yes gene_type:complete